MTSQTITCLIIDDEPIARDIIENHINKISQIQLLGKCKNATEALHFIEHKKVDLLFLDINMPSISGITLAKSLHPDIKIIFTTAYREFALEGFEVNAIDYLLKPISFEKISKAINTYSSIFNQKHSKINDDPSFIFIRSDRRMKRLDFEDILYIERFRDYLHIQLTNHTIVSRENLDELLSRLPNKHFIRIHRSYIVAIKAIDSYTKEHLEINNKLLPISRSYRENVLNQLDSN